MGDTSAVEERLGSLFDAVGRQVPNEPTGSWIMAVELEGVEPAGSGGERAGRRGRRWRRTAIGAGVLTGLAVVATGTAAAAGLLPFSPSQISSFASIALGKAPSILGSPHPNSLPGALVRVTSPGPDGTVLTVTSANGDHNEYAAGSCETLTITMPSGAPAPGSTQADKGGCDLVGSDVTPLTPQQQEAGTEGGQIVTSWLAPSGVDYTIVFGEGDPGTASVALTNDAGQLGAKVATQARWFVIYLPTSLYQAYGHITFYSAPATPQRTLPG